jgi:predicted transcriptional regulator
MTPWTAADVTALRRMVREDVPDKGIARRLGRTLRAVQRRRELLGLRKHGRVRRRVLRLLRAGYTTAEVAAVVGRTASCVRMIRADALLCLSRR